MERGTKEETREEVCRIKEGREYSTKRALD
jgi:hypothetical protein